MAALNEEQSMIKDQAAAWAADRAPVTQFRALRDSGNEDRFDPAMWNEMVEMGWTGIIVPEAYGGVELGYLTFGVILEELGKHLVASPLVPSALVSVSAILLGGSEDQKSTWLPKIVDGSSIYTLAVDEGPRHSPANIELAATKADDGFTLSGAKTFVLEGMVATDFIVAARTSGNKGDEQGITLFRVAADAAGVTRSALDTMDSRGYAVVTFDNVAVAGGDVIGAVDGGFDVLTETLNRACAGLGAEMLGTSGQAFEITMEYLKTRVQFGNVIGSFQALGHRAAEMFTEQQLTRSCVEGALQGLDAGTNQSSELCSLSKCRAGELLQLVSTEMIQIHGGIGMTDECDVGLYLKRARTVEPTFGNQSYHRDRYATLLGF